MTTEPTKPGQPATSDGETTTAWRRLGRALRLRPSRAQLLAAVLCAGLGFGTIIQVRHNAEADFSSLREVELMQLLDELTQRSQELTTQNGDLQTQRDRLMSSQDQAKAALEAAQARSQTQAMLAGTVPAQGPGIVLTIFDPDAALTANELYHVLEEFRNAGAEAISLGSVRAGASTWIGQGGGGQLETDGKPITSPYVWRAIGDPHTLEVALNIPGGVIATVRNAGANSTIERQANVLIEAVREISSGGLASPVPEE